MLLATETGTYVVQSGGAKAMRRRGGQGHASASATVHQHWHAAAATTGGPGRWPI
jgi:hypothetical protein